jgi:hypothetical protein
MIDATEALVSGSAGQQVCELCGKVFFPVAMPSQPDNYGLTQTGQRKGRFHHAYRKRHFTGSRPFA